MSWTTPVDLRAQVLKLWNKGALLADTIGAESMFPVRLRLKGPSSNELSRRFDEVREWIATLRDVESRGYRIVWRGVKHPIIGQNQLPAEVWIDTRETAIKLIGKTAEASGFQELLADTRQRHPELVDWLVRHPIKALKHAQDWPRLLDIVSWLKANPRPGIYLRQIDIPDVHSKFIESNRGLLSELLDAVLPREAIDHQASGARGFCRRYGLRDKPALIRFRLLDAQAAGLDARLGEDLTISADAFAGLEPGIERVFITENEINFLTFPSLTGSLLIFGAGYGFETLARAEWLSAREVFYWGDIDTHGFAILDQLRARFPDTKSLLMDRETLLAHRTFWVREPKPQQRDLNRLDDRESQLYDDLRCNRLGESLRLEQERIGFRYLRQALHRL